MAADFWYTACMAVFLCSNAGRTNKPTLQAIKQCEKALKS